MVYCVSRRAYGYGFIIAALADGMSLINRVVYGYGWSFDRYELIILAVPFAMWLICMIVGAIIKGKRKILIVSIATMLLASGRNDHSESGEINQFQPLENSQCTSATPFLS